MSEKYFISKTALMIKLLKKGEAARKCINTDCIAQKIESLFICSKNGMISMEVINK